MKERESVVISARLDRQSRSRRAAARIQGGPGSNRGVNRGSERTAGEALSVTGAGYYRRAGAPRGNVAGGPADGSPSTPCVAVATSASRTRTLSPIDPIDYLDRKLRRKRWLTIVPR